MLALILYAVQVLILFWLVVLAAFASQSARKLNQIIEALNRWEADERLRRDQQRL